MAERLIQVCVVYSPAPRQVVERALQLAPGATVHDAVQASGLLGPADRSGPALEVGLWGRRVQPQQLLREGDRVELYRPLQVDPKVARRERFKRQGSRTTGLFAKRRPGSKPGY